MTEPNRLPGDENVERLVGQAYRPDPIDPEFVQRVHARLGDVAAERRPQRLSRRRLLAVLGGVAAMVALIVLPPALWRPTILQPPAVSVASPPMSGGRHVPDRLTVRPRGRTPTLETLAVGRKIRTSAGQRRRVCLPDGSLLSLNESTAARLDADRRLTLSRGEVFVEVAPRTTGSRRDRFMVRTPQREVIALGTRFAVRAGRAGTGVLVTQGKVEVSGLDRVLVAGQQLAAGSVEVSPAVRASHALAWTRDLLARTQTALVPASAYRGGALIATGPDGRPSRLSLRRYHIDVHIEDGFARTTIDQTYFNAHTARLEGTFHFPLPADASLSRLAMYVDGTRMEGGMVERDYGRSVYEGIVRRMQDPALLEWVDGTTFKMRVFPLEARQEKRIILSYTQKLPSLYGRATYRFPAGHSLEEVRDWSFLARIKDGAKLHWHSPSHALTPSTDKNDLLLSAKEHAARVDRDVVLELEEAEPLPPAPHRSGDVVRFSSADNDGARYLMVRYRPVLPVTAQQAKVRRRDWVFLFESSAERDPLLARTQIEIIRHLLENCGHDDTFAILTAGTRCRLLTLHPLTATPANVRKALAALEKTPLIGALDLEKALVAAEPLLKVARNPHLVHVGSGLPRLGERRPEVLVKRLPTGTRYVGVGVGKRWNRSLMKAAADGSGGYFTQINPDEPVGWRAFDLLATLNTPRLLNIRVEATGNKLAFLTDAAAVAQGEELCAVARAAGKESSWPASVVVSGTLDGKPFRREFAVAAVVPGADYLPRTWGRLEIDRLLAERAEKNKQRIIALSKSLYVMSPFTSLLVLENEAMYRQYKVDRGRKDHWAPYPCPERIPVVTEPLEGWLLKSRGQQNPQSVLETLIVRSNAWPTRRGFDVEGLAELGVLPVEQRNERMLAAIKELLRKQERVRAQTGQRRNDLESNLVRGLEPEVPTSYDVSRIQDVSVPGPVDPNAAVGGAGAPEGPPVTLPPPPDSGRGQGGSPELPDVSGGGVLGRGFVGGYGGFAGRFGADPLGNEDPLGNVLPHYPAALSLVVRGTSIIHIRLRRPQSKVVEGADLRDARAIFRDLVSFAPGMDTTLADVLTVLEAEARLPRQLRTGKVAPAARTLIDKARAARWEAVTIPARDEEDSFTIVCDGQGRCRYERTLDTALRELVVCDGKTLLHLYPELGLGARRHVSRFHRRELCALVPWLLPPVNDLAQGADVVHVDEQTVAIVPHTGNVSVHLVFAAGSRLAERRLFLRKTGRLLVRQTYAADGTVRLLDADGKLLSEERLARRAATAPDLRPNVADLVVLPLPWRTLKIAGPKTPGKLARLASLFAEGHSDLPAFIIEQFLNKGDRRRGLFTLLAARHNLDARLRRGLDPKSKLGDYLLQFDGKDPKERTLKELPLDFLSRMKALYQLHKRPGARAVMSRDYEEQLLQYVRLCRSPRLLWSLVRTWRIQPMPREGVGPAKLRPRVLEAAAKALRKVPGFGYAARYEYARCLLQGGAKKEAHKVFEELYAATLASGVLPRIDADFRRALEDGDRAGPWRPLMRRTTERLLKENNLPAALAVVKQCWSVGDVELGDELVAKVVTARAPDVVRVRMMSDVVALLLRVNRELKADELCRMVLAREAAPRGPELWRTASQLAGKVDGIRRALPYLEKALELEWQARPALLDVQAVRRDYEQLLAWYSRLAQASADLGQPPPAGLTERVVQAAERWRSLDRDGPAAEKASDVLVALGERELAWDYLTTWLGRVDSADRWRAAAKSLRQRREFVLAERALAAAAAVRP